MFCVNVKVWPHLGIPDKLARVSSALGFLGPKPALGVSRRDIRKRLSRLINQHWASWCDPGNTLRQARELISGPCLGTRVKFLSFNRTQSRVVTGLLKKLNLNSVALVRERTIPTERPPPVGEVSANFCG
jgi:hypothetical protein